MVGCGFTSHSAICQLYSDGTVVQFQNFDLLPGTQLHGQLGVLAWQVYPDAGTGRSEDVFNILAIRGPTRGEGMRGIEPGSSDPATSMPLRRTNKASETHTKKNYFWQSPPGDLSGFRTEPNCTFTKSRSLYLNSQLTHGAINIRQ